MPALAALIELVGGPIVGNFVYGIFGALGYTHPFHPVLTHLVVGPVIAAFLISLFGWIFKRPGLLRTARHLTVFAFVLWFFTAAMGFIDWQHFYSEQVMTPIIMKMILAGVLFVVLLATILLNRRLPMDSKYPILLYAASTICVLGLGYFGGNLVYG